MRERPMLFNGAMVRAILGGRKTQTRRVMKPQPDVCPSACPRPGHRWPSRNHQSMLHVEDELQNGQGGCGGLAASACPFGEIGDRLWVRETWGVWDQGFDTAEESGLTIYRADTQRPEPKRWRPSIHMPREACRLVLEITNVRIERLQAIRPADALAEGAMEWANEQATPICDLPAGDERIAFSALWDSTGGSWEANPWVWVVEFRIAEGPANG